MNEPAFSRPVFILGCPRSGTSVLSWALAQHRAFWTSAESDFLFFLFGQGRLGSAFRRAYDRPDEGWLKRNDMTFEEFAACLGRGVEAVFASRAEGKRWVDSTPGHTLMAEELAALLPGAQFIHILRDGRAVVHSMIHSGFERLGFQKIGLSIPWAKSFGAACRTWVHYARKGRAFAAAHPDRCLEVRQEDLLLRPEALFDEIFAFLAEPADEAAARFVRERRLNSSFDGVGKSVEKQDEAASVLPRPWEGWKRSMTRRFRKIAGPAMAEMGYEL